MKNWIELISNPASIQAIYGRVIPTLKHVDLHEIVLHRDGPQALLRFDLAEFPERPPSKWAASGFNRVQIKLMVVGVEELDISGLQTNCQVDLAIFEDGSLIRVRSDNGAVLLNIAAHEVFINNISAYREVVK
jgi:Immunity protein 50